MWGSLGERGYRENPTPIFLRASSDPGEANPSTRLHHEGKRWGGRESGTVGREPVKPPRRKRRRSRLLIPLGIMIVMAFLYYRPLASYLQTRSERETRMAQVVALRAEKQRLERRLARTTSDAALAREARRIGYVKPGERLFIVKGIPAWQGKHHTPSP